MSRRRRVAAKAYVAWSAVPRVRASLAVLAALMLAGCLQQGAPSDDPGDDGGPSRQSRAEDLEEGNETVRTVLGEAQGGATPPGELPFTALVPDGGANEVEWSLLLEGPYAMDAEVAGHGCRVDVQGVGVSTGGSVMGSAGGSCSDLPAGEHGFRLVLREPALSFRVQVSGILAKAEASANATEP